MGGVRMKIRDVDGWNKCKANNQDPYGMATWKYAERWADAMEAAMADGTELSEIAEAASRSADTDGITGFMYGCAVSILSHAWAHGEELRRWHNIDCQIGDEGERANESGGVLNPAILNLAVSK